MSMIEAVYSWQTAVAMAVAMIFTQILKVIIDFTLARQKGSWREAMRSGADERRIHPATFSILMPLYPIVFAIIWATLTHLIPEALAMPYEPVRGYTRTLMLAGWGLIAGIFASALFAYVSNIRNSIKNNRAG